MKLFNIHAILTTLSTGFSYLNLRFMRRPNAIGQMAMALSLPPGPHRQVIPATIDVIVVFSIIVQGLTIGRLVRFSQLR